MVTMSLLPYFPETRNIMTHLETWGVEISSMIVTSMTLMAIVWCYGVTRMVQMLAPKNGGYSSPIRITILQLMGNIGLVLLSSFAGLAIFTRAQESCLIGPVIAILVMAIVILSSIIGVCILGSRRELKHCLG